MSEKWDRRFLAMAELVASWSKDPSTQCGCVLVDSDRRVISLGYNGPPQRVRDTYHRLNDRATKLAITLHAEDNALNFARRSLVGCAAYVWPMPPCSQCAARLIQAGIARIVSVQPSEAHLERWGVSFMLAADLYQDAGVTLDLVQMDNSGGD
jgi:dCMP deaminase